MRAGACPLLGLQLDLIQREYTRRRRKWWRGEKRGREGGKEGSNERLSERGSKRKRIKSAE